MRVRSPQRPSQIAEQTWEPRMQKNTCAPLKTGTAQCVHRQKSIHSGRGKLFGKMELTAREGTRHRRAVHFHGCGPQTGTADGYPPVPNEGAESIALRAEEHRAPSAHAFLQRPQGSHASMPVPSWRGCH